MEFILVDAVRHTFGGILSQRPLDCFVGMETRRVFLNPGRADRGMHHHATQHDQEHPPEYPEGG